MDFFVNDLGGLLFGGAILTTAALISSGERANSNENNHSIIIADDKAETPERPMKALSNESAVESYQKLYDMYAQTSSHTSFSGGGYKNSTRNPLVLSPRISNQYTELASFFSDRGLTTGETIWFLTVDMNPLLEENSFSAERSLSLEFARAGIVIISGETWGAETPGKFRISFDDDDRGTYASAIINKFSKIFSENPSFRARIQLSVGISSKNSPSSQAENQPKRKRTYEDDF